MNTNNSMLTRVLALVAVVIVGGSALVYAFLGKKMTTQPADATTASTTATVPDNSQTQTQTPAQTSSQGSQSAPPASTGATTASVYMNGTYTATGSYVSPGGNETIGVSITLANDIVTAVTVTPHPENSEDGNFQGMFAAGISSLIVGKNIADANVTHVSGSSLTSGGFNQAVAKIEAEAKA